MALEVLAISLDGALRAFARSDERILPREVLVDHLPQCDLGGHDDLAAAETCEELITFRPSLGAGPSLEGLHPPSANQHDAGDVGDVHLP